MKKEEKKKDLTFYATKRHQAPHWLILKINDLVGKAKRLDDSSSVLYACLEARNLLEMISSIKLLCSVPENEREALTLAMKPQRGIETVDKDLKSLKLKTQEFMSIVSALENYPFPIFGFAESNKIQYKLSQYVHTYTLTQEEAEYGSQYIKDGFRAIKEAVEFANRNMQYFPESGTTGIVNAEMGNLPDWASQLLDEWKIGKIKNTEALGIAVKEASDKYVSENLQGEQS